MKNQIKTKITSIFCTEQKSEIIIIIDHKNLRQQWYVLLPTMKSIVDND